MYAITGISGKVGGTLARSLLSQGQAVRAVVRSADNGASWTHAGCEVRVARMDDVQSLTRAFESAEAVFILPPPIFDPAPGFPEMRSTAAAVREALQRAQPARVLCLSTIGAQDARDSLLSQLSIMEAALSSLSLPITFLRPAWYLDNSAWDVGPARQTGAIPSFLAPLERPLPMVSTEDVGLTAARLIQHGHAGIVELEGPRRVSPRDLARSFAQALKVPIRAQVVPRTEWEALFRAQGMRNPIPRMRMLDGFNEGWIDFSGAPDSTIKGTVDADEVVGRLVATS